MPVVNFDYLDQLYRWKAEAEEELKKLKALGDQKVSQEDEAQYGLLSVIEMHSLKIKHAEAMLRTYNLCIREYLKPTFEQ